MSNLATKLKTPELELPKDFDCALDFDFSPDNFGPFKVNYNT